MHWLPRHNDRRIVFMRDLLNGSIDELAALLPLLRGLSPQLEQLGEAMMRCWDQRGKVLLAGNGGSAADAMHLGEELTVRFQKNRRALAAVALMDPTALTCCGNDFGYERVFSRQIEALGNEGDVFIAFSTSGNSPSILKALEVAKQQKLITATFLGKDGGKAHKQADIELLIPSQSTARIQEAHQVLFHVLCQWIDARVD